MTNTLPYNSESHDFSMAYVSGNPVNWVYIPGKGHIAIDKKTNKAYILKNDKALNISLTDYDINYIRRYPMFNKFNPIKAVKQKPSDDLLAYAKNNNYQIKYTQAGIPYADEGKGYHTFNDGTIYVYDKRASTINLAGYANKLKEYNNSKTNNTDEKATNTSGTSGTKGTSGTTDTSASRSNGTNTTTGTMGVQQSEYSSQFDGTQLSDKSKEDFGNDRKFKSFSQAFNYYRNKGKGTFAWNGKLYNTMKKGEDATLFRKDHASYDSFLGTIGNDGKDGGWGLSKELQTNANLNAQGYNEMLTVKEQPVTPQRTRLSMFTNDDIRNLGFNNYSGLVNAVSNKANANNNFVKALTDRYGADTSKWNQSTIENELGVKGKYRRFGRGDFGDMSRSMAGWVGKNNGEIDRQNLNDRTGSNGTVYSNKNVRDLFEQHPVKTQANTNNYLLGTYSNNFSIPFNSQDLFKIGSNVYKNATKFQEGGQINMDEQQLQQAFIQYLMEKTGAQSQQELEQVMQQLGEDGLKLAYAQFVQEMQQQQVQAARFGAKLNYINYLNGKCPEGMQMRYFKVGGKLCKKCMQAKQNREEPSDPIKAFKCGRKIRKNR